VEASATDGALSYVGSRLARLLHPLRGGFKFNAYNSNKPHHTLCGFVNDGCAWGQLA
jgi:hypothetical protein